VPRWRRARSSSSKSSRSGARGESRQHERERRPLTGAWRRGHQLTADIESIVKASVIYGSRKTVIDKIMSLRERSGPWNVLLKAAMDGSGKNRERERLTMRRLAEDVLPVINAG